MRHVRDVEHDRPAVDVADPGAVRPARIDVRVVGAEPGVELRMASRRGLGVAVARAGQPPAADLDRLRRLPDVDDPIELIVLRIARLEVRRAGGQVQVGPVDEPQVVHAPRVRPGGVEERDRARLARVGHVEELDSGRLHADPAGLVGDDQEVAHDVQVVRAHVAVGQIGLDDHRGLARIGHVHGGEVLGRRLVAEPQDPPAVAGELDGHALSAVAETAQIVVAQEPHLLREGAVLCHGSSPPGRDPSISRPLALLDRLGVDRRAGAPGNDQRRRAEEELVDAVGRAICGELLRGRRSRRGRCRSRES